MLIVLAAFKAADQLNHQVDHLLVVSAFPGTISPGLDLILGHLLRLQPGASELVPPALVVELVELSFNQDFNPYDIDNSSKSKSKTKKDKNSINTNSINIQALSEDDDEFSLLKAIDKDDAEKVFSILRKSKIDFNSIKFKKQHPLMIAVENDKLDIVKLLIENGAKYSCSDDNWSGLTAFELAANHSLVRIVEYFISLHPNTDEISSALCASCCCYSKEVGSMLLNQKPNLNYRWGLTGATPLMHLTGFIARQVGDNFDEGVMEAAMEGIEVLLSKGADRTIKDDNGRTVLDYTKQKGFKEFIRNYQLKQ